MKMKRVMSLILTLALLLGVIPAQVFAAGEDQPETYSMSNGFVRLTVSAENGGFAIDTEEGDRLKKSDNNKWLLFHNSDYDTSFISFRVTDQSGNEKDYIFGGKYGGLGDASRQGVTVSQPGGEDTDVSAVWGVGDLEFTVSYSLANRQSLEFGMASIAVAVKNTGSQKLSVKARILYDTALGSSDSAWYQVSDGTDVQTIHTETVLDTSGGASLPQNFYAADNARTPSIVAYTANAAGAAPYMAAFGHWNNLGASLFDFAPDSSLDFTNAYNDYYSADSAYALYYDMGSVSGGEDTSITTYYGVFANSTVSVDERVSLNITAPNRIYADKATGSYVSTGIGETCYSMTVTFDNYQQDGAEKLDSVVLAVQPSTLRGLNDDGEIMDSVEAGDMVTVAFADIAVGESRTKELRFTATPGKDAVYEKLTVGVYDISGSADGKLSQEMCIGERTVYVLLPGLDNDLPKVGFVEMSPSKVYVEGTRHLYLSLTNSDMLQDPSNWDLYAYNQVTNTKVLLDKSLATISDNVMEVVIGEETKLATGTWQLQLEWTDAAVSSEIVEAVYQHQTADCLQFEVSDDATLKNDVYGVAAVVRYDVPDGAKTEPVYRIKLFKTAEKFDEFAEAGWEKGDPTDGGEPVKYKEITFIFRGEFTLESKTSLINGVSYPLKLKGVSKKSVDSATRKTTVSNCMTINDCLDFEDGTMTIYYEGCDGTTPLDTAVKVTMDGDLLTSGARTSVWKGKSCFNPLKQGEAYSLIPYDHNGERMDDDRTEESNIYLAWPLADGIGKEIMGMFMEFAYGELGIVYGQEDGDDTPVVGRVISFSASLDLSFTGTSGEDNGQQTYWSKLKGFWKYGRSDGHFTQELNTFTYMDNSDYFDQLADMSNIDEGTDDDETVTGSVMIHDVLYGCGEGFYGIHFKVSVGIQNYVEALPVLQGTLEVNTISDWSFGFEGGMTWKRIPLSLEATLSFKSIKNIPVPDNLYVKLSGFNPGFNVDGLGIVWITGAGGGFSDLYETILCSQKVPPIRLLLSISFSIMQVLDGDADLSIGPTGFELEASDLKILDTIECIKKITLALDWYPGIEMKASVNMDMYAGLISGAGYLVVSAPEYTDPFVEFFVRAQVKVPGSIPVVGGLTFAGVDLGVNSDRIWGAIDVSLLTLGITYYWGADGVDFGEGSKSEPTYPELLGCNDVPVYYDETRQDTLYMRMGTNISQAVAATVVDSPQGMQLMAYPNAPYFLSDLTRTTHKFRVDNWYGESYIAQFSYTASDLADAKAKAAGFTVKDADGNDFPVTYYNGSNLDSFNASVTFDDETDTATFALVVGDTALMGKEWTVTTGTVYCDGYVCSVTPLPAFTDLSAASFSLDPESATIDTGSLSGTDTCYAGSDIAVVVTGENTDIISYKTDISYAFCETNSASDPGTAAEIDCEAIGFNMSFLSMQSSSDPGAAWDSGCSVITVPADLPSGSYYLRATLCAEGISNNVTFSSQKVTVINSSTPETPTITTPVNAGSLCLSAAVSTGANTDGFFVSVLNADGSEALGIQKFAVEQGGSTTVTVGGAYQSGDETYGLEAGKTYQLKAEPYKELDKDGDGTADTILCGTAVVSDAVTLREPTVPVFSFAADKTAKVIARQDADNGTPYTVDTYTEDALTVTVSADCAVSGDWYLDGSAATADQKGTFSGSSFDIALDSMTEGDHSISLTGEDSDGDVFTAEYSFCVDTLAPKLVVSSPVNGSFFSKDGSVALSCITDADAVLTVKADGQTIAAGTPAQLGTIDATGLLTAEVVLPSPDSASVFEMTITAEDGAGNVSTHTADVYRGGVAGIQSVEIQVDGKSLSSGNIPVQTDEPKNCVLRMVGVLEDGSKVPLTGLNNSGFTVQTVKGSAAVDADGNLSIAAGSEGIVNGRVEITSGAYMTYTLTFGASTFGLVETSYTIGGSVTGGGYYNPGDTVTVTAVPESGYVFDGWTAEGITLASPNAATQTFTMPEGYVELTAAFRSVRKSGQKDVSGRHLVVEDLPAGVSAVNYVPYVTGNDGKTEAIAFSKVIDGKLAYLTTGGDITYGQNTRTFAEIEGHWGKDAVEFCTARGILSGYPDGTVKPDGKITRAMVVSVLYMLSGRPADSSSASGTAAGSSSTFPDVRSGQWYSDAIAWAAANGIVSGYANGNFGPDDCITREQLCTILCKYALYEGLSFAPLAEAASFGDSSQISGYARTYVSDCQQAGIVSGRPGGTFDPKGTATRAEFCAMVMNFIDTILRAQM